METKKLQDICKIRSGYAFRGAIQHVSNGSLAVLQPRDIMQANLDKLTCINPEQVKDGHHLQYDDILLTNRGTFKAHIFSFPFPTIATGGFFVLTVQGRGFLPAYIALYLNSQLGQNLLLARQEVSTTSALNRSQLEQIDIPCISLERQERLCRFHLLHEKEYNITQELLKLKEQRIQSFIKEMIYDKAN